MLDAFLALDTSLFLRINGLARPDWLTAIMSLASAAGAAAAIWVLLGLIHVGRHTAGVWRLVLALLFTYSAVELALKPTLARDRPSVAHADVVASTGVPVTASFPSGHAASSGAGAFALSRIWPGATPRLWALAVLIGCSRVYLGVHYPLDVLAGLLVGLGCAYFVTGGMVYCGRLRTESKRSTRGPAPSSR